MTVQDVIRAVAGRGAASFGELERAFEEDEADLVQALDVCIDHGYLTMGNTRHSRLDVPYRLTRRGRRMLRAGAAAVAAA